MQPLENAISEADFLKGHLLKDALFTYGNSELIKAIPDLNAIPASKAGDSPLQAFLRPLAELQFMHSQHTQAINVLKGDILELLRKGELIAYGFKYPRKLEDTPIKIPADLLISGEINWDISELKYQELLITGIRLIKISGIQPVLIKKELEIPINEIKEIEKPISKSKKAITKKPKISELEPEHYVDEKTAAEYLGLSYRTLQGYRTKGGGPEFAKIGKKTIRYQIAHLINWAKIK